MASSNPSFDADGSIVDVQWSFASTPRGSIVSPNANTTTYQAPSSIGSRESVTVRLTVTDDDGATASTTVVLTLAPSGGSGSSSPGGGNGWVIGIGGGDVQIGDGDD
jgi:chitinase